jgi:OFA family oxalate/formate antiporter-like MFS transporter
MIMFITQAALYFYLPFVTSTLVFTIIACYLLSCLGVDSR